MAHALRNFLFNFSLAIISLLSKRGGGQQGCAAMDKMASG